MKSIKFLLVFVGSLVAAQITIEKNTPSQAPANASVSIELGNATGGAKGIVLPWVTDIAGLIAPVPGTLVFDTSTQKIKFSRSANSGSLVISSWVDLSDGAAPPLVNSLADANPENSLAKALVGGNPDTDVTMGVLVLADTDKAMVLPRVNSYKDIVNPSAGMMVYVTSNHQLAVYNGREWSFWKP
ncbi:hypothetical protein GCM10010992_24040 [Cloacibacterium rupense]|uniref:Uncharacterized protein n=1 Tax=Cloacibacterium rupense TaxID=517423 RepID=A0ABQ2NSC7_9FLAO|nr:hypothetical protein [Cloacibacterium rupense]GGP05912.1 hypothetical protein GCM10010992_24040 [Cloacibacterium rupense]